MKKRKTAKKIAGAMMLGTAFTFTACNNNPACVYGPAPEPETIEESDTKVEATEEIVTEYNPEEDMPVDVYGPMIE